MADRDPLSDARIHMILTRQLEELLEIDAENPSGEKALLIARMGIAGARGGLLKLMDNAADAGEKAAAEMMAKLMRKPDQL